MDKATSILIDDFYYICELLDDDIDLVCDFIKQKCTPRVKRSMIKRYIEAGLYRNMDKEIDRALDHTLEEFARFKQLRLIHRQIQDKNCVQTSIFDYM